MSIWKHKANPISCCCVCETFKEDLNSVSGLKAESNSISNQKQLILDYLKDKTDINLVSIREDDGYTGTDYDRPDFQRMMDDIRAGVVNCVIVKICPASGVNILTPESISIVFSVLWGQIDRN